MVTASDEFNAEPGSVQRERDAALALLREAHDTMGGDDESKTWRRIRDFLASTSSAAPGGETD